MAALLLQKNVLSASLSTPAAIKNQIENTALKDNVGGYGVTDYSLARYGAGFIDIHAALGCSSGLGCTPPSTPPVPVEETSAPLAQTPPTLVEAPSAPAPAPAAPAPAPAAPAPAPVAAPPVAVEVIGISSVVKRRFTLTVASPAGSKTWIQRKSGKRWVTIKKVNSTSSSVIKVGRSGTYRIQIVGPSRKVVSSPFRVR